MTESASLPTIESPGLRLRQAGLTYGGRKLFDALDLDLEPGRTTCLLGPSGVGKSSLLRLIAGLGDAASGRVSDETGAPLTGRIAYMAQQDLLLPWLSAEQNVLLGARLRGRARRDDHERARTLLAEVGLAEAAKLRPAALSGGMRQRVALARTLFESKPIVLMDEPFSALDAITRYQLQALSAGLLRGRTVLLVTHDPLEALRLGERILVLTGRPARLEEAEAPSGAPPHAPDDPKLMRLQADLLERLARAKEESR
ncbi:ABC transporter ATP-binding protein [Limibacillus halophilus]|jgi:putative hydroxymethylpyrimidine transport system ATP-binding protein